MKSGHGKRTRLADKSSENPELFLGKRTWVKLGGHGKRTWLNINTAQHCKTHDLARLTLIPKRLLINLIDCLIVGWFHNSQRLHQPAV